MKHIYFIRFITSILLISSLIFSTTSYANTAGKKANSATHSVYTTDTTYKAALDYNYSLPSEYTNNVNIAIMAKWGWNWLNQLKHELHK